MKRKPTFHATAFTLVEMLIALAILGVIVVLAARITGHTTSMTLHQTQFIGASAAGRALFDRLTHDLDNVVIQNGAPIITGTQNNHSRLAFLCFSRPGLANPDQRLSLVSYNMRSPAGSGPKTLFRDTKGVSWIADDYDFATLVSDGFTPSGDEGEYENVIAFNLVWLNKDNSTTQLPEATPIDLAKVCGFIVTIAVLDKTEILHSLPESTIQSLETALDTTDPATSPMTSWQEEINKLQDHRLRENIRIFQRIYYFRNEI
jgi:prepilin-type N-terminal cleavage/methylation domain-containing protein